jgi:hypothetical protein
MVPGGGKPVFPREEKRHGLRLVESRVFDSQVVLMRYRRAWPARRAHASGPGWRGPGPERTVRRW